MRNKVLFYLREYLREYLTDKETSDLLEIIMYEADRRGKKIGAIAFITGFLIALLCS